MEKKKNETVKTEQTEQHNEDIVTKTSETAAPENPKKKASSKKTNKTWEAFGRSKGCFIINDPKFLL